MLLLIPSKSSNIDVILGHGLVESLINALIDCAAKTVQLTHPSGQIINYSAQTIQNAEAQIYALECVERFTP